MQKASESLDRTAARIAAGPFTQGDSVDLSAEMVALMTAKNGFDANVTVARTEDEMSRSLLKLVG
jgi:flagellar basal body rod protein FlgC